MFFPKLEERERALSAASTRTEEDERVLASLRVLLSYLRKNYRQTLARIDSLLSNGEITFDLLYALFVPGTIVLRRCPITREPRAMRLVSASQCSDQCGPYYSLNLTGLESAAGDGYSGGDPSEQDIGWSDEEHGSGPRFGFAESSCVLRSFPGVARIDGLGVFPLRFHAEEARVRAMLVARARQWAALARVGHMFYRGPAVTREWENGCLKMRRYTVASRVMVDKGACSPATVVDSVSC